MNLPHQNQVLTKNKIVNEKFNNIRTDIKNFYFLTK